MGVIKIMMVDDSPFSRTILADTLREFNCEIVGEADSIESLIETYKNCKPDIVTMDIAMPGADGFECSKALLAHDPSARIVLISSMKDEETESEARRTGIMGYIQKPADAETAARIFKNVLSPDVLYQNLEAWSLETCKEALSQSITRMTKTTASYLDKEICKPSFSKGIAVVIGIIGRYPGTFILDIAQDTAEKMATNMLRREPKNREEIIAMAAEFANVVGGIACSMINKKDKNLSLRVAPPSVFYGATTEIVSPNICVRMISAQTDFGDIDISIGFKKGNVLWM
ncbi:response regulator [Succinispira mobilis]|uniref:response regulator n=1 Tax=Succinispira mobilis TaxID=78120 RepID=UPI00037E0D48|nr:response regulator [Succinispira mobilis]